MMGEIGGFALGRAVYRIDVGSLLSRIARDRMGSASMGCGYRRPPPPVIMYGGSILVRELYF